MTKYIIVLGGVISGVGKGIATASIGKILQEFGYKVTAVKIDPYINQSAGTLRPTEHGETWVTCDGKETDQDLGNYERIMNVNMTRKNSMTTGQVYKSVIDKEMAGYYNGETVQFIPHITNEIKERLVDAAGDNDIVLVEVGGICGDYENIPFLSAIKGLESDIGKENIIYILVTYMLVPSHLNEMKTKPTQTAIHSILQYGIIPDIIMCRGKEELDDVRKKKIETYVNIKKEYIISAVDTDNIYKVPINLEKQNLGQKILTKLSLEIKRKPDWTEWCKLIENMSSPTKIVKIAMVGKYLNIGNYQLSDVYISVNEALKHTGAHLKAKIQIDWISSVDLDDKNISKLADYMGIIVPGGFGSTGINGIILAIEYARKNNIPYLGLCYGMQLAVVEFARNVCGMVGANTTEIDPETTYPVVDILDEQKSVLQKGDSMRLGSYPCIVKENTNMYNIYADSDRMIAPGVIIERHRHRYEVNNKFVETLENNGLVFSGYYLDKKNDKLMEFIELPKHKFFVASQAHPEFTSKLLDPNPLFMAFVKSCIT